MSLTLLVTGGAGYIGSHTLRQLVAAGHRALVVDDLSRGHREALPREASLLCADIRDHEVLARAMTEHSVDAVLHFAGAIEVGDSMRDPQRTYGINVVGSLSLLAAMREAGVEAIVFSSSAAVYGIPDRVPIPEDADIRPVNVYGVTKAIIEEALRDYNRAYGLSSLCLRYFNAAGAAPDGSNGEAHDPETHLIPLALRAADGGEQLQLFGDDYDTPDGTAIRDYVHVEDLAAAHVAAVELVAASKVCRSLNLGTGRGCSVREVLTTVERVVGRRPTHSVTARRAGDPPLLVARPGAARDLLGWEPRLDLEEILRSAWVWHQRSRSGDPWRKRSR